MPPEPTTAEHRPTPLVALVFAGALLPVLGALMLARPAERHAIAASRPITYRVDVNTADTEMLCLLPGIGPGLARRVVEDRRVNGAFTDPASLERVPMIGGRTREGFEPWITVGGD